MIQHSVPARVGLLGNPSDSYGGRTMSLAIAGMMATVSVYEDDAVRISGPHPSPFEFESISDFAQSIHRFGYGTGEQLLAATLRTFLDLAQSQHWDVPEGVAISFDTEVPRGVGLAGSSALVIALLRCLLELCDQTLDSNLLPALALSVETDQLGLFAGLQDRVIQTYGGLVAMDFHNLSTDARTGLVFGAYESLDVGGLPPLFLAYSPGAAEPSSVYHSVLRGLYESGDAPTVDRLHQLAGLVTRGKAALRWGGSGLAPLLEKNMALRASLAPLPESQMALVEAASALNLSCTFAGSGGAVVGVYSEGDQLESLREFLDDPESRVLPLEAFSYT